MAYLGCEDSITYTFLKQIINFHPFLLQYKYSLELEQEVIAGTRNYIDI